ncbi:hypothetical protein X878_0002 [Enterococcus phage VD13]|uniref:Uncharacterized protein n=1 Tax=Enterococcus phage VD13 TaxID=1458851 RepID=X2KXM2_9CAUD|nr:ABC transporter [Enterococcus phage VD13]YP_009592446.1 ABC transporter [Enterococcus phage VD13]AHL19590.1 hypothetical protein VD13_005 [Enterococcus phage VD13]AHN83092.1 hypothetical protein X878_0002 [Enterococcus phage VD13]
MKLIDGEALLTKVKNILEFPVEDDWDEGWNIAVESCMDEITAALDKANEEAAKTPVSMDGMHLGYLTPSETSIKAPESDFKVVTEDNTLTALNAAREAIEDSYDTEAAVAFIDGMITALEM